MTPNRPRVNLVVNLPGAVSAGSYGAGVLDFLIEALDAFSEASRRGDAPPHDVVLTAISGTSAGAQTALIFTSAIGYRFAPATGEGMARNPFFEHWVVRNDLRDYLTLRDAPMRSLLDPTNVEVVADSVLRFGAGLERARRPWVADTLRLGVAVTNLRGVPTPSPLGAGWGEAGFTRHADAMYFAVGGLGLATSPSPAAGEQALAWPQQPADKPIAWSALAEACVASGAFPLFFASRSLERPASGAGHRFCAVDGGLFEGNPLAMAARLVAAGGGGHPTVLLRIGAPPPAQPGPSHAAGLLPTLLSLGAALLSEARDRPLALDAQPWPPLHAAFTVAPHRPGAAGEAVLAGAGLGGFAGYFSQALREHDFLLGRSNARAALARDLCLPLADALFSGWTPAQVAEHAVGGVALPVIPLVGSLRPQGDDFPAPPPREVDVDAYAGAMRRRIAYVLRTLRPPSTSWVWRGVSAVVGVILVPPAAWVIAWLVLKRARKAIPGS